MYRCSQLLAWLVAAPIVGAALFFGPEGPLDGGDAKGGPAPRGKAPASAHKPSAAYQWVDIALEAVAREHERVSPRPTIGARMVALIMTAMYDAWAAYDAKAVGSRYGGKLRRPAAERTVANKARAIGHATYRAMLFLFPEDARWIREEVRKQGIDPDDNSTDVTTPQGIGNVTAAAVADHWRNDGANQFGNEVGSDGKPYSDWTCYRCINTKDRINDPDSWQPIEFDDGKGGKVTPGFLTPHWYRVRPFALERSDQFRPGPPPKVGSAQIRKEVDEVLSFNGNLSPEQKAVVEFMRDGPKSTGQSGHWMRLAQAVSRRDGNDLDRDVKMFFCVAIVVHDAFIACWDSKRIYDSSRPWTLIRHYYKGKTIVGWAGPGKGVVRLRAEDWHPYSPMTFITPPFPGYVSGHSTASGAGAKILELFTGSDRFGDVEKRTAGALTEPGFKCETIQMRLGKPGDSKLTCDVALQLPTFSATAEMAGISRVMGGYHIQADNIEGLKLGRRVATYIYPKLRAYWEGTAR